MAHSQQCVHTRFQKRITLVTGSSPEFLARLLDSTRSVHSHSGPFADRCAAAGLHGLERCLVSRDRVHPARLSPTPSSASLQLGVFLGCVSKASKVTSMNMAICSGLIWKFSICIPFSFGNSVLAQRTKLCFFDEQGTRGSKVFEGWPSSDASSSAKVRTK